MGSTVILDLMGAFVTAILQSSTATALMAASFVTAGTVDLFPALAVTMDADALQLIAAKTQLRGSAPAQPSQGLRVRPAQSHGKPRPTQTNHAVNHTREMRIP